MTTSEINALMNATLNEMGFVVPEFPEDTRDQDGLTEWETTTRTILVRTSQDDGSMDERFTGTTPAFAVMFNIPLVDAVLREAVFTDGYVTIDWFDEIN